MQSRGKEWMIKHRKIFLFIFVVIIGEFFLSNKISFLMAKPEICDLNLVSASGENFSIVGYHLSFQEDTATVDLAIPRKIKSYYISLVMDGEEDSLISGHIQIEDDSRTDEYHDVNTFALNPAGNNTAVVSVESFGNLRKIRILFSGVKEGDTLRAVRINDAGLAYNFVRVMIILLISGIIYAGFSVGILWESPFSIRNKRHTAVYMFVIFLNICLAWGISYATSLPDQRDIEYPLRESVGNYDINIRTFDALMKGELYLETDLSDVDVNLLSNLDNPYDRGEREGINYHWDYAFYNGHYYRYFGIAPVITYYVPYYIVHHTLPNMNQAAFCFEFWFILFLCGSMIMAIEIMRVRLKVWTVVLMALLLPAASLSFVWEACADMYYLPFCSAYTFLAMFMFFTLCAFQYKSRKWAFVFLVMAALGVVFAVASRPLIFIPIFLMMLPIYIQSLRDDSLSVKRRAIMVACFAIPVLTGAVGIMYYNAKRFGSPFDFGEKYQLTVSDISYNHVDLSAASIWSYIVNVWFRLVNFSSDFSFISFDERAFYDGVGKIMHKDPGYFGILVLPLNWFLLLLPYYNKRRPALKAITTMGFCGGVMVTFLDYHLGGATSRYLGDVLLSFALIASLIAVYIFERRPTTAWVYTIKKITMGVVIATLVISYLLIVKNERNYIRARSPDEYLFIRSLFQMT